MQVLRIALLIGLAAVLVGAEDAGDYEYEDESAPTARKPSPAPAVRGRAPPVISSRNKIQAAPAKPTKPVKPAEPEPSPSPAEQSVEEEEEELAEVPVEETSTEPPKKTIKPIVRPFRSNDDLLAALKRRRQQAQQLGTVVDRTSTTVPPSTESPDKGKSSSLNLKGKNTRGRVSPSPKTSEVTEAPAKRPPASQRKPAGRTNKPTPSAQPEDETEQQETPTRPKFNRGSRKL